MDSHQHWENLYQTKPVDRVSWFRSELTTSLALIERVAPDRAASILDVGGGASTLVDDLVRHGYANVSVLDISSQALAIAGRRLGPSAARVTWLTTDLLQAPLESARYDVWHDRAMFHFLVDADRRAQYVQRLAAGLKSGGYAILATFGPAGPRKCSGLDTARYDAEGLQRALGSAFTPLDSLLEIHRTPFGTDQQFLYGLFRRG